jgi:hypothetical protein
VAYYPLDGTAEDATGNGRNGLISGDVVPTIDRYGNPAAAMAFDGAGDYIQANAVGLPSAERTIALWFAADSSLADHPVFLGYGTGCGAAWFMGLNNCGRPELYVSAHCENPHVAWSYPSPPVGRWRHAAISTQASGTRIYVDGVQVADDPAYFITDVAGTDLGIGVDMIGTDPYTDGCIGYFRGSLDELRIYDRALTPEEIARLQTCNPTDVSEGWTPQPTRLHQNVPNPFNPTTTIFFSVRNSSRVELAVFDLAGQRVRTLLARELTAGSHRQGWDGLDDRGRRVASGVYLYRLRSDDLTLSRRMVLIR